LRPTAERWPPAAVMARFCFGTLPAEQKTGNPKTVPLSQQDLNALWSDLAGDASKADQAVWALALAPKQCAPLLKDRLLQNNHPWSAVGMNDRIVIDPLICHGKPVIRGTRTPVAIVVGSLAGGMSFDQIECEYDPTTADIRAAPALALRLVENTHSVSQCDSDNQRRRLPRG
jgi:uncharacterized protein (DUF433 family)